MRVNARWMMALLLMLAMFISFSVVLAQDEENEDTSTDTTESDTSAQTADNTDVSPEPTDAPTSEPAGVGEVAKAADNLNVSAVPTQQQAQAVVTTPPLVEDSFSPAELKQHEAAIQNYWKDLVNSGSPYRSLMSHKMRHPMNVRKQTEDIIWQFVDDTNGVVLTVFTDYSVVATDPNDEVFFQGYLALSDSGYLMTIGEDTDGNQYALSNGYILSLTTEGDVLMGHGEHVYFYDYDEDGNFVSLTDSDGNEYDVAADEDGNVYITDADGNTGEFYADGSYAVYDEEGTVFDEGALFGDNDNDTELGFDEGDDAASFDENSDEGEAEFASDEEAQEGLWDENTDDQSSSEDGAAESADANVDDSSGGENNDGN